MEVLHHKHSCHTAIERGLYYLSIHVGVSKAKNILDGNKIRNRLGKVSKCYIGKSKIVTFLKNNPFLWPDDEIFSKVDIIALKCMVSQTFWCMERVYVGVLGAYTAMTKILILYIPIMAQSVYETKEILRQVCKYVTTHASCKRLFNKLWCSLVVVHLSTQFILTELFTLME